MKSLKKTLVLLVVLSMIFSTFVPAFAATDVADLDCEDAVLRMEALDIIAGFEDGTFRPNETITRAQMAVIICKMTGITEAAAEASKSVDSKFTDVKAGDWYTGYINIAAGNGIIAGFPDGTFRPNEVLTLNQVLTLCVKALGRGAYVDQMGTWPANYVTEAAKLGLLDDVKSDSADANRGNVAIIAWNTLQARLWDVNQTKLDGEVSLGNTANTLLNTHFRTYCFDGELKEVKEVPVTAVPSTNQEIGGRQIVLDIDNSADTDFNYAAAKAFDVAPSKNADETTYKELKEIEDDGKKYNVIDTVVAYVPEDVYGDIDNLLGRKVTVIFGDDNEVALVIVEDEVVVDEYLDAYEDKEIVVAGEKYKFVTTGSNVAKVFVNTIELTGKAYEADDYDCLDADLDAEDATADAVMPILAEILDIEDLENIEKVIKANIVLDPKGTKIARLDLFVSGEYAALNTHEGVVEKVSREVIYLSNDGKIDYKDVEKEDLPKVIKNGEYISIEEIEAGDVLTYYGSTKNKATTIYVSSEKAEGKVASVRKANKAIKLADGTYAPSTENALMTTKALKDGEWDSVDTTKVVKNDEVVIYLNIYGEYCAISLEKEVSDWEFGVVTLVYDDIKFEGEDDEIETRNIKLLVGDATKGVKYTVKADTSSDDIDEGDLKDVIDESLVHKLVMFIADADKNIDFEDLYVIDSSTISDLNDEFEDEYVFAKTTGDTFVAGKRIDLDGETAVVNVDYRYSTSTALFNLGGEDLECGAQTGGTRTAHVAGCSRADETVDGTACDGTYNVDIEVIKDWEAIINASNKFVDTAIIVAEDGEEVPVCIALFVDEYATSDAMYAMVDVDAYETEDEDYVTLLTDGNTSEEVDLHKNIADAAIAEMFENAFIEYYTTSGKINGATALVDVKAFNKLASKDDSTVTAEILANGNETTLINDLNGSNDDEHVRYENFEISKIIVDEDDYEVVYTKINDPILSGEEGATSNQTAKLASVLLEKGEITVYDLRDGFTTMSISDLVDEVNDETREESIMVVAFKNTVNMAGSTYDADILVIL